MKKIIILIILIIIGGATAIAGSVQQRGRLQAAQDSLQKAREELVVLNDFLILVMAQTPVVDTVEVPTPVEVPVLVHDTVQVPVTDTVYVSPLPGTWKAYFPMSYEWNLEVAPIQECPTVPLFQVTRDKAYWAAGGAALGILGKVFFDDWFSNSESYRKRKKHDDDDDDDHHRD